MMFIKMYILYIHIFPFESFVLLVGFPWFLVFSHPLKARYGLIPLRHHGFILYSEAAGWSWELKGLNIPKSMGSKVRLPPKATWDPPINSRLFFRGFFSGTMVGSNTLTIP